MGPIRDLFFLSQNLVLFIVSLYDIEKFFDNFFRKKMGGNAK